MKYQFDHFGIPVTEKQKEMIYFPEYKVWTSDYEKNPYRIERLFFEKDCTMHPLIQSTSHICFLVNNIQEAVENKIIILEPQYYQGYYMAFIAENDVPIEFIQPTEKSVK